MIGRSKYLRVTNGGGGGKASAPPPPPPPAPPPPPPVDQGQDPSLQAEIEKQRAARFAAGKENLDENATGTGTDLNSDTAGKKTLLGQ
jgi:hypothetical protein